MAEDDVKFPEDLEPEIDEGDEGGSEGVGRITVRPAYGERKERKEDGKRVLYRQDRREEHERKRELEEFKKDLKKVLDGIKREIEGFRKDFKEYKKEFVGIKKETGDWLLGVKGYVRDSSERRDRAGRRGERRDDKVEDLLEEVVEELNNLRKESVRSNEELKRVLKERLESKGYDSKKVEEILREVDEKLEEIGGVEKRGVKAIEELRKFFRRKLDKRYNRFDRFEYKPTLQWLRDVKRSIARETGELFEDVVNVGIASLLGPLGSVFENTFQSLAKASLVGIKNITSKFVKVGIERVKGWKEVIQARKVKEVEPVEEKDEKEIILEQGLKEIREGRERLKSFVNELMERVRGGVGIFQESFGGLLRGEQYQLAPVGGYIDSLSVKELDVEGGLIRAPQVNLVGVSDLYTESLTAKQLAVKVTDKAKIEFEKRGSLLGIGEGGGEGKGITDRVLEYLGIRSVLGKVGQRIPIPKGGGVLFPFLASLLAGFGLYESYGAIKRGGVGELFLGRKGQGLLGRLFFGTTKGFGLGSVLGGLIGGVVGGITTGGAGIIPGAMGGAKIGGIIGSIVMGLTHGLGEQIRDFGGRVIEELSKMKKLMSEMRDILSRGGDWLSGLLGKILDWIKEKPKDVKEQAQDVGGRFKKWVQEMLFGKKLENIEWLTLKREIGTSFGKSKKALMKGDVYLGPFQMKQETFEAFAKKYGYWEELSKYPWMSKEFKEAWGKIIDKEGVDKIYEQMKQHIVEENYLPMLKNLGFLGSQLIGRQSKVLEAVLFDVANQYGPELGAKMLKEAFKGYDLEKMSVEDIIRRIYEYRRESALRYFKTYRQKYPQEYKNMVESLERFEQEALKARKEEVEESKREQELKGIQRKSETGTFIPEGVFPKIKYEEAEDEKKREQVINLDVKKLLPLIQPEEGSVREIEPKIEVSRIKKFMDYGDIIDKVLDKSSEIEVMKNIVITQKGGEERQEGVSGIGVAIPTQTFASVPNMVDDLVVLMLQLGLVG